ncbi:ribosomal protein S7 domain-containing protein [Suillus spraguei]|nr:ribosomal protein S7 domain-containing protein [Suillus spraguei]
MYYLPLRSQPRIQLWQTLHKCSFRQHPIPSSFPRVFLLNCGKRARAERIRSRILIYIHTLTCAPPLPILRHALFIISPAVKFMSQKRLGKNVLRPAALTEKQRIRAGALAVLVASKNKSVKTVEEHLARGIIVIVNGHSKAISDKEVAHKQAAVNRGNALVKRRPRTSLLFYIVRADFV